VIEASQAGYRRQEGDIDREGSQLIPKVIAMLRQDGVPLSQMAAELQINVNELRGLLFSTYPVIEGDGASINAPAKPTLRVV
jgi:hypothetical protein